MRDSGIRTELPLIPTASGCACCSTDTAAAPAGPVSGEAYSLEGLSCAHCVQTVEKAVSGVPGVDSAAVDLVPGGVSSLRVTGSADAAAIRAAVVEAGYSLS